MAEKQNAGAGVLRIDPVEIVAKWAVQNRPHLAHLAVYAKRRRARKKNANRILREFMEG